MCIDLHTHSHYSDGSTSPAELVRMAVARGISGLALTDHDTLEGIDEFLAQAPEGIDLIPGLELSATHRHLSLHILGYGMDHTNASLLQWLRPLQEGRVRRNEKIMEKLRGMGHDIHIEELGDISSCGQTGRPHIAQLLTKKGIVRSPGDAFTLFLRKGGPAFADRFAYSAAESIDSIHRAGGIAVLAHPGILNQQTLALPLLVAELVERGLDGIEVFYPKHTPEIEKRMRTLARKYHLVLTGGSDYHGHHRSYTMMADNSGGFCPADSLLGPLKERIQQSRTGVRPILERGTYNANHTRCR